MQTNETVTHPRPLPDSRPPLPETTLFVFRHSNHSRQATRRGRTIVSVSLYTGAEQTILLMTAGSKEIVVPVPTLRAASRQSGRSSGRRATTTPPSPMTLGVVPSWTGGGKWAW
jgi:hypothetical protein